MAKSKKSKPKVQPKKENGNQDGPAAQNILPAIGMDAGKEPDFTEAIKDYEKTENKIFTEDLAGIVESADGISLERWQEAQEAERNHHVFTEKEGIQHYKRIYGIIFNMLELGHDLQGLDVMEVGPADFPALRYCTNRGNNCIIIEPMPSELLRKWATENDVVVFANPVEHMAPYIQAVESNEYARVTEVWLFNVMQHIINPSVFVKYVKTMGHRIRFFEPINYPTAVHHPHTYTLDDFKHWFGDCVKFYKGGTIPGFHQADCAYGVYVP